MVSLEACTGVLSHNCHASEPPTILATIASSNASDWQSRILSGAPGAKHYHYYTALLWQRVLHIVTCGHALRSHCKCITIVTYTHS
jgi:hypothetical protein